MMARNMKQKQKLGKVGYLEICQSVNNTNNEPNNNNNNYQHNHNDNKLGNEEAAGIVVIVSQFVSATTRSYCPTWLKRVRHPSPFSHLIPQSTLHSHL